MSEKEKRYLAIENLQKQILQELTEVKSLEKKVLGERQEFVGQEEEISQGIKHLVSLHKKFVHRISQRRSVFSTLLAIGVVFVSRGIWELSEHMPFLSSSWVTLALGITILIILNKNPHIG